MPLDVRKVLSDWLDKVDWPILNPDNPEMTQYTVVLANQLITELEVSRIRSLADRGLSNEGARPCPARLRVSV